MEIEILKSQIELLECFWYTHAYTGELGNLKQGSYVEYSDILKILNQKRAELNKLIKQQ